MTFALAGLIFSALAEITPWTFQAKDDHSRRLAAPMAMTPMQPPISIDPWAPGFPECSEQVLSNDMF